MVSHEQKYIYIHIPKCAGTSIGNLLGLHDGNEKKIDKDHSRILDIMPVSINELPLYLINNITEIERFKRIVGSLIYGTELTKSQFNSYYKFSIVRNPWSRAYSWYNNVINRRKDVGFPSKFGVSENCTFEEFLNSYQTNWGLNTQLYWLNSGKKNNLPFDFIGKFENLENDFKIIASELKLESSILPKRLVSENTKSYTEMYTPKMKDLVAKVYKDEIKLFNYEFEN
jgi:hypothetical protein